MKTRASRKDKSTPSGRSGRPRALVASKVQKSKTKPATSNVTQITTSRTTIKPAASETSTRSKAQTGVWKKKWDTNYRECAICAEMKPVGRNDANFPRFAICDHEPLTCSSCVLKHTIITLKTRATVAFDEAKGKDILDWSDCTCTQCNASLKETDIRSALSRKELVELNKVIANRLLESHPRWIWCTAANCSSGQIFPEGQKPEQKVTCVKCGAHTCFFHHAPWHNGYTCSQYDDQRPDAQSLHSSEERIKRISKKCPTRGCGWRIQKEGGCSGMW